MDEYEDDFDDEPDDEVAASEADQEVTPSCGKKTGGHLDYSDLRILKTLGGGAFAVIYSATLGPQAIPCAVKVLVDSRASMEQKQDFQNELRALEAAGNHPHVVRLLGARITPKPCFVMELLGSTLSQCMVDGPPRSLALPTPKSGLLSKALPRAHTWPLHCVLSWAADVASGLAHLHGLSPPILHRDVKAANVLIRQSEVGGALFGVAVLTDFGISFSRVAAAGTPTYMAPELLATLDTGIGGGAAASSCISRAADMYAFGTLLWSLLSGEEPWEGWRIVDIKSSVCAGTRPEVSKLRSDTPKSVLECLNACWRGEPGTRLSAVQAHTTLRAACAASSEAFQVIQQGGGGMKGEEGGFTGAFDALDTLAASTYVNKGGKKVGQLQQRTVFSGLAGKV